MDVHAHGAAAARAHAVEAAALGVGDALEIAGVGLAVDVPALDALSRASLVDRAAPVRRPDVRARRGRSEEDRDDGEDGEGTSSSERPRHPLKISSNGHDRSFHARVATDGRSRRRSSASKTLDGGARESGSGRHTDSPKRVGRRSRRREPARPAV